MANAMGRKISRKPITEAREAFHSFSDDRKRITARIDPELHADFKVTLAQRSESINEVIEAMVVEYVRRHRSETRRREI